MRYLLWMCVLGCGAEPVETPRWGPMEHARYRVEFGSTLTLPEGAEASFALDGVWAMSATPTAGGITIDARIESPRVVATDPTDEARLRAHFARPFRLRLDATGVVTELAVAPDTAVLVQTTLKSLAAHLQIAPGQREADTTGVYRSAYAWEDERFVRRKLAYERVRGDTGLEAPGRLGVELLESRTTYAPDLSRVEAVEALRFGGAGFLPGAEARSTLTFSRLADGAGPLQLELGDTVGGPLYGPPTELALQYELDRAKDPGDPFDDLLRRATAPDLERVARDRLYMAVVARLRWSEPAVAEAVAHIVAAGRGTKLLTAALGHAGSPPCQQALVNLTDQGHAAALLALSSGDRPTVLTVAALRGWLDDPDLGRQALYALGSVVHRLRPRAPQQARAAFAHLTDRLSAATSRRAVVTSLRAIGNAGHPDALPTLSPYLSATDPAVRMEALEALRRVPGAAVDSRLEAMARSDRKREVRDAASALLARRQR